MILFKIKVNEVLNEININKDKNINSIITDPEILYRTILEEINEVRTNSFLLNKFNNLKKIDFEKDIPELGHVQFIHSYANLKAKSYKIPCCNKFYTLEYVGKIAQQQLQVHL